MGLTLYYKENDEFVAITKTGDLTNPLRTSHDGKSGDVQTVQVFLRNDDATKWFSNIRIKPLDLIDANPYGDIVYSETGWGVKLSAGAEAPVEAEWDDIDWGTEIEMPNIGSDSLSDVVTYYPLWFLITCPPNTNALVKTDIVLNVAYTENSVIV